MQWPLFVKNVATMMTETVKFPKVLGDLLVKFRGQAL